MRSPTDAVGYLAVAIEPDHQSFNMSADAFDDVVDLLGLDRSDYADVLAHEGRRFLERLRTIREAMERDDGPTAQ